MSINVEKLRKQFVDEACPKKRKSMRRMLENCKAFFKTQRIKAVYLVDEKEYMRHFTSSLSFIGSDYPYLGYKELQRAFIFEQENEFEECLEALKQECLEKDNGLIPVTWVEYITTDQPFYE